MCVTLTPLYYQIITWAPTSCPNPLQIKAFILGRVGLVQIFLHLLALFGLKLHRFRALL
jgi:hypothetical protein